VLHHSQFLFDLIESGRIELNSSPEKMAVCYHDSCFLGRYNNIYDEPRKILTAIKGINLVEMEKNQEKSFCCGAGGGRMWMEEHLGRRINEMRTIQALDKNPDAVATACPYCLTMLEDGLKTMNKDESVKGMDIAEFIFHAMKK
jgi:Fe-S oxidoreductase